MTTPKRYSFTEEELQMKLAAFLSRMDLDNQTANLESGMEGDISMPKRLKQKVTVKGAERWIDGYSVQELFDNYVNLLEREGLIERIDPDISVPLFGDYLKKFYAVFKQQQERNTVVNRERIIKNHILPKLGSKRIDHISTFDIQIWFNEMNQKFSRETIQKIKNTINPVFDAAVEDNLIPRNPLKSKRIQIGGKETVSHKAIPHAKFELIKAGIRDLTGKERRMCALLCYTGMRFEEVLGLKWEDISDNWIRIERAVVHPTRNQPEVKSTKSTSSERVIPLNPELKDILGERGSGFVLSNTCHGETPGQVPLTYTVSRRVFDRIRQHFHLDGYSAHDFRDTCATEWRRKGVPLDVVSRLLGHADTQITERRYIKYETDLISEFANVV